MAKKKAALVPVSADGTGYPDLLARIASLLEQGRRDDPHDKRDFDGDLLGGGPADCGI